ncbi:hypothetical protein [Desulfospira joergensenii]|uniref:hypothetical protein n=1 Tax=Desulfospira joergensenii TaxID=53329 RepID=UPI0003B55D04|nr:hypothetical protein [Desulfospira joergensenii]
MRQSIFGETTYLPPGPEREEPLLDDEVKGLAGVYDHVKAARIAEIRAMREQTRFVSRNRGQVSLIWHAFKERKPPKRGHYLVAYNSDSVFYLEWSGDSFINPVQKFDGDSSYFPMADPLLWMEVKLK